jgi:hypothetical protein
MTKAKVIALLTVALACLHASASFAAEENKSTAAPVSSSAVAPEQGKVSADDTLFTRVNGTYRKTEKRLLPQT